ncbi:hypothetical protein N7478_002911 [Penicillium angulare]|uniref:uncharacterized protein n=1 Tax=Penicillium angulare TaxID=116970 RepID=UPI00254038E4|nr:uncharacterized protein N7478_002911 [Penicillium angulare]KAJ5287225.1 hypothetical protein N7478_002911 [Penicillium angulare]
MSESTWEKTKRFSKKGFDKTWATVDKLGAPVNRLSNKLGAEAFWPMSIDKESDKAARILRSFCKDGFYAPESEVGTDENGKINRPKGKQKVIQKIPSKVIQNAKGIAIFTTMRTGLWVSGSGGSGVLLGRVPETGEWSPPSGIMLHTAGIGFLAGVDIYDCVVIINTYEALEAFKKLRCTLGGEVSVAAGPVGMGGVLESEVHKRQAPIWTYMKSKGLYAGVAVDGTIIIERTDENERFYGERISVTDILNGKARHPPESISTLLQTIKSAQGDRDVDETMIPPPGETPGDIDLGEEGHPFGVPAAEDPDPYGVKALEAEGMFIREAGTKVRPSPETFEFRPNPGSPVYATFSRRSLDSSPRNSWRGSLQSYASVNRGTQTDDLPLTTPTSVSRASSRSAKESTDVSAANSWAKANWDTVTTDGGERKMKPQKEEDKDFEDAKRVIERAEMENEREEQPGDYEEDFEVHEVSNATMAKQERRAESPVEERPSTADSSSRSSPNFTRARLVTIPKRPAQTPPALPPRHPHHTWGSGSSRESTSPTALSHSSRSTEPTEAAGDSVDFTESTTDSLPSNVKKLQTNTVLPAVVDEDDFDDEDLAESDVELPTEKDEEFHSVNGDFEEHEEDQDQGEDHTEEQQKDQTNCGNSFEALADDFNLLAENLDSMDIEKLDRPELDPVSQNSEEKAEPVAEEKFEPSPETESLKFEALEAATKNPIEPKSDEFDRNKSISEDETHDLVNIYALNAQAA